MTDDAWRFNRLLLGWAALLVTGFAVWAYLYSQPRFTALLSEYRVYRLDRYTGEIWTAGPASDELLIMVSPDDRVPD